MPEIVVSSMLGESACRLIELSKSYQTVVLLCENDFSGRLSASWAELDRLNLRTKKIGEIFSGIEVHTFGMDDLPDDSRVDLQIRETSQEASSRMQNMQQTAYKSLLNEVTLISVKLSVENRQN